MHNIAGPKARNLLQDTIVRGRSEEDLKKPNKSSSRSQDVATIAKRWLQDSRCGCRCKDVAEKVAAGSDIKLQEPIHDYRSQDVTARAMMRLQD